MAVIGQRCARAKPSKEDHTDQSHRRRPMRHRTSPRNQPGIRREPRDQHGEQDMKNARARTQGGKKNSWRPKGKEEVPKKIKARAWRNKSIKRNKSRRWRKDKRQRPIQEINQNKKTKPSLDYAGVTLLSSRD